MENPLKKKNAVKDKRVNAGIESKSVFNTIRWFHFMEYAIFFYRSEDSSDLMSSLPERGSTTAFISGKVGMKRRSEQCCLIVKWSTAHVTSRWFKASSVIERIRQFTHIKRYNDCLHLQLAYDTECTASLHTQSVMVTSPLLGVTHR